MEKVLCSKGTLRYLEASESHDFEVWPLSPPWLDM